MLNLNDRFSTLVVDLERPVLHVALDLRIVILAADKTLCVEDSVFGVGVECILGRVTDTERKFSIQNVNKRRKCTYSRSSSVKETHEGVIRWPWSLAMISTRPWR